MYCDLSNPDFLFPMLLLDSFGLFFGRSDRKSKACVLICAFFDFFEFFLCHISFFSFKRKKMPSDLEIEIRKIGDHDSHKK